MKTPSVSSREVWSPWKYGNMAVNVLSFEDCSYKLCIPPPESHVNFFLRFRFSVINRRLSISPVGSYRGNTSGTEDNEAWKPQPSDPQTSGYPTDRPHTRCFYVNGVECLKALKPDTDALFVRVRCVCACWEVKKLACPLAAWFLLETIHL